MGVVFLLIMNGYDKKNTNNNNNYNNKGNLLRGGFDQQI